MDQATQMAEPSGDTFSLFKMWELSDDLCSLLKKHGITTFLILEKMEADDVIILFDKFDTSFFGEMFKFKAGLREWRNSVGKPLLSDRETLSNNSRVVEWLEKISSNMSISRESTSSAQLPPVASINKSRLINLLKSTAKGQMTLAYNEKYGYLDSKSQNIVAHCIVDSYFGNSVKMSYAEMQTWANAICEVFPKEKSETYYLARKQNKKNPTGKLFSRWTNVNRVGLTPKALPEDPKLIAAVSSDEYCERKCWLQHNCSPWEQVILYWKDTSETRVAEIKRDVSLKTIFEDWPRYTDYSGYDLIAIDFESLYPGKGNLLFLKLETFCKSILDIFEKEIKDRPFRELYLKHLYNKDISNDTKYCITTILLHALLPPQRLNKNDKPTIADAQNDFVTLVATPNDIQQKVSDICI